MRVTIYIETTFHGSPAVRDGAGMWLAEYIRENGTPETREGIIYREATTEIILTLLCMQGAFSILTKSCQVEVNTSNTHVLNVMQNHNLPVWEKNGWITARGREVKNKELWQACRKAMEPHTVETGSKPHSYRSCMRDRVRKEAESHVRSHGK